MYTFDITDNRDAAIAGIKIFSKAHSSGYAPEGEKTRDQLCRDILHACCDFYNIEYDYIFKKVRYADVVKCRHVAMFLMKKYKPEITLKFIGKIFSLDHTTVIHGINTVRDICEFDKDLRVDILLIEQKFIQYGI